MRTLVTLSLVPCLLLLTGCPRTRQAVKEDTKEATAKAKVEAKELGQDVKEGAEKAAEATSEAVDEAGQKAAAAARTMAVKTALMADKAVDASHVDVDSTHDTKVVHLRGTVKTDAEKAAAEAIAKAHSDGWAVSNELTVSATPAPH